MKAPGQLKGSQGTRTFSERQCLRCGAQFPSISKSNRICISCAAKREFSGAGWAFSNAGRQAAPRRPADCLTPDEAGALLGISGTAIKARIRRGTLKAIRTDDDRYWVKAAELGNEVLERRRSGGKQNSPEKRPAERKINFNLEAAKEFGFRVEKAKPARNR